MTTTPPQLSTEVYAQLPLELNDLTPGKWTWINCLTIPHKEFNQLQLSNRPYKWIRYAIGVVVGAKGVLSTDKYSIIAADEDAALPAEQTVLYYHVSDEEKRRMFPIDPHIARSTSSRTSSGATDMDGFIKEVAERDGKKCVFTGTHEENCHAVHLLCRSHGDQYIASFTSNRSRESDGSDIINSIDDCRNGLLVNVIAHRWLGKSVAIMKTPNFAMGANDIDPHAPSEETTYTLHRFFPSRGDAVEDASMPMNRKVRISTSSKRNPPAILFDAVYAGAVTHHFGTQELKDGVNAVWKGAFYPGGIMTGGEQQRLAESRKERRKNGEEHRRRIDGDFPDPMEMLMAIPFVLMPPGKMENYYSEMQQRSEEEDQERVEEKVNEWLKDVQAR